MWLQWLLQGSDCKSQWNCCFKVMFGREESNETLRFLAQSGSRRQWAEPCCATGAARARARPPLQSAI